MSLIISLFLFTSTFLFLNDFKLSLASESDFKLELLQVLFRHGDRTPDKVSIYKTDPYDSIYREIGYGQLTKIGMRREYKIGQELRERYGNFLGEFKTEDVYARSTDFDRTKMSLQLLLAGLYPPTDTTSWNSAIPWSPIPTHYEPIKSDFINSHFICPRFSEMHQAELDKIPEKLNLTDEFLNRVYSDTGVNSHRLFFHLYASVRSNLGLELPLPDWCSEDDYKMLQAYAEEYLAGRTATETLSKITTGLMIEEFLKNIDGQEVEKESAKKIYLYGAHEFNVAAFNSVHKFSNVPKIPDYGSTVVVEKLRGKNDQLYVRMFLWTGVAEQWIPLKLEDCDYECPLSDYKEIIGWALSDAESRVCYPLTSACDARSVKRRIRTKELDPLSQAVYMSAGGDAVRSLKYADELF